MRDIKDDAVRWVAGEGKGCCELVGLGTPRSMEMHMQNVEIRIKGCLDEHWSEWFNEFEISHTEANETILKGKVQDQSDLYGLIAKLRDLGVSLIAVNILDGSKKRAEEINLP